MTAGTLLLFDLDFLNFARFDQLTDAGVRFVTRKEARTVARSAQVLRRTERLHDTIARLGSSQESHCTHPLRVVEWLHQGTCYRYLTNVLDPQLSPAEYVVALYWQR